jgi:tripartite-type tricarboxylate transporter receptor subunit TctC
MRAAPDGYTLLANQTGIASMPALYPNLQLNVERDLAPIGLLNGTYSFLVGRKSLPANSMPELIAWMKGPGAPAKFAHPGVGTLAHLTCFIFASASGTTINLIPYRGGGPAMNDLVGEQVDLLWAAPVLSNPLIETGKIKVFAGGAGKRAPSLQHVPTLEQVGFGPADILYWQGLFAPAGTPAPIVDKLNAALREALGTAEVQKAYADVGTEVFPPDQQTPGAAAALLHRHVRELDKVVRENGIQAAP